MEVANTEAGAESSNVAAELQGDQTNTPEEAGADTLNQSAETDGEAGNATDPEAEHSETEGSKGKHQTTFEERLKQIEAKSEARLAEIQAKFEARQVAEVKPFVVVDMAKVNAHLTDLKDAIADAELKGDIVTALDLEEQIRELRANLKENDKKRDEWESKQSAQQKHTAEASARLERIDASAEFYREQKNIPKETWQAAGVWISEQFQKDPVLGRKFAEMIDRQGEMAAFEWADKYCQDNMGAGAKADKDAKELAKSGLLPVGSTAANATAITTWDGLMKMPGPEIVKFEKEHPAVFQKLKDAHFK